MNLYHYALLLLTVSGSAMGQDIPKKAEAITITTTLPDSLLMERTVDKLTEAGYMPERVDMARKLIVTSHKTTARLATMRVLANIADHVLTLRGQSSIAFGGISVVNDPVVNKGMASNSDRMCFKVLNDIAQSIQKTAEGSTLAYVMPSGN